MSEPEYIGFVFLTRGSVHFKQICDMFSLPI